MYEHHLKAVIAALHPGIQGIGIRRPPGSGENLIITIIPDPAQADAIMRRLEDARASITPRGFQLAFRIEPHPGSIARLDGAETARGPNMEV